MQTTIYWTQDSVLQQITSAFFSGEDQKECFSIAMKLQGKNGNRIQKRKNQELIPRAESKLLFK